jgi:GNAT superfamily N-acetyltransferase
VERVAADHPEATALLHGYRDELRSRLAPRPVEGLDRWDATAFGPPGGAVLVARREGRPVGCVGLRTLGPGVGELKHLFVPIEARGRGVARELLVAVEHLARALGHHTLVLDTAAPLVEAAALYRASGYSQVPAYNDNPHAAAWFRKELAKQ